MVKLTNRHESQILKGSAIFGIPDIPQRYRAVDFACLAPNPADDNMNLSDRCDVQFSESSYLQLVGDFLWCEGGAQGIVEIAA